MAEWISKNQPDYRVVGVDNLSGGNINFVPRDIEFLNADLVYDNLEELLEGRAIQYVYHFAAYAAEGLSPFIRKFNYENNLLATASVVNFCINHNVERLIFTSSMAVYGAGQAPFAETDPVAPIDPYGIAKYACEMDIKVASEQHGLEYCIIRPHNVYGINQNIWDKYRNVLGIWMFQKINDQPISIFGKGEQKRAFSYIDDSLWPLWNAATSDLSRNQTINLGGIEEISIKEAAIIFEEIVGGVQKVFLPSRHEVQDAFSTHDKSEELLGFKNPTSLRTGLKKMWEWARNLDKRPRFEWGKYEIDRGIYDFWKKQ
ncbi:MAG: NAD-dependent epimerase/dehydratase family protein [Cyclobacteriaceae bacterium]